MKKRSTTSRLNKVDYAIFIIFSIAAAVMLYLFYSDLNSFTIKQSEEPIAKIYFKKNTAQRKFLDSDIWEVLTNSSDIYDGDRIRTSKNSEAYTEFNDSGIQIQLREKSMIQLYKNKENRSVDFIGGEIFVANNSPEQKLVVHSGKKEIAVTKESEVKIILPEVSEAAAAGAKPAEESPVVVEVVSGQVEIKEEPAPKAKSEKVEPEPIVVSAGQTVVLEPVVETPPVKEEPVKEKVKEKVVKEEPVKTVEKETEVEAAVENESEVIVATDIEEDSEYEDEEEEEEDEYEYTIEESTYTAPAPILPQEIEYEKDMKTDWSAIAFNRSNYFDETSKELKYNFSLGCDMAELTGRNRSISKGCLVVVEVSGVSDGDIAKLNMELIGDANNWTRVHPWIPVFPDYGRGIKAGVPFTITRHFTLNKDIENTSYGKIGLSYEPEMLDEPATLRNFEIKMKVYENKDEYDGSAIREINWKFAKTLDYDSYTFRKDVYGKGKNDFNYVLEINGDMVFGKNISISRGTKLKITVSGVSDRAIQVINLELWDGTEDKGDWTNVFFAKNENDYGPLKLNNFPISKGKEFKFTKSYTIKQNFLNSNFSVFSIKIPPEALKDAPVITDLHIDIVVEQ